MTWYPVRDDTSRTLRLRERVGLRSYNPINHGFLTEQVCLAIFEEGFREIQIVKWVPPILNLRYDPLAVDDDFGVFDEQANTHWDEDVCRIQLDGQGRIRRFGIGMFIWSVPPKDGNRV